MTINERNQQIMESYAKGSTANELSRVFGLSIPRIRQIVAGVERDNPQPQNRKPISETHRKFGLRVYDFRYDAELSRRYMAEKLGWSVGKLANIEQGLVDPTLLDLQDLATFMRKNMGELLDNVFNR